MKPQQHMTTIVGFAVLAVAIAIGAWPETTDAELTSETTCRVVRVEEVSGGASTDLIRLAGVTRAARRAELGFAMAARLASRSVEIGDRVEADEVLAVLDDREQRLSLRASEAAAAELDIRLAQAERDLERVQSLVDARAATTEELERNAATTDALSAARTAAQARLDEARRMVDETVLRAPFAGTVTAVSLEPGEWVTPGRAIVEMAGDGAVEVAVEAPESVYSRLSRGADVEIHLPFVDRWTRGRITEIAVAASGTGRLFPVEITLDPDPEIVAGLTANVFLTLAAENELTVPLRAVLNPGSTAPAVFRIADGLAHRTTVELGRIRGDRIAVTAELVPAELVAVDGHTGLRDGDPVEVRR